MLLVALLTRLGVGVKENSTFVPVAGGSYIEGVVGQPTAVNPVVFSSDANLDLAALMFTKLGNLVARSELTPDGRSFTITLKEDLVWDDGEPLSSNDIIYTVETIQNPEVQSPLAKDWQGVIAERISQIQVKFTFSTPPAYFKENVMNLRIIPRHVFGAIPPSNFHLSAYLLEPVGNGAYRFADFSKRRDGFITRYHLVPNERFASNRAFIKDFYVQFYENEDNLVKDFELRRVNGFGSMFPPEALAASKIAVTEKMQMPLEYAIFINQSSNPFLKDDNLRYALAAAIDKKAIVEKALYGEATVAENPLPFDTTDRSSHIPYNLDEAKRRIAALESKPDVLTLVVPNLPFLEAAANMVKDAWISTGIPKVDVIPLAPDEFLNKVVKARNYDLALFGMVFENPNDLFPFWHSSERSYPGLNFTFYQNAMVDALIESSRQSNKPEKQKADIGSAENLILKDNPAIFLFSLPYFYLHTDRLYGFEESTLAAPSDRFDHVNLWSVIKARVLK